MRRVILFLNGAFGIGKSTVARLLRSRIRGCGIYDPEPVGRLLQLTPAWVLRVPRTDDFQDMPQWRRLSILGITLTRRIYPHVVVPMAISNPDYLHQLIEGAQRIDPNVRHFCLTAPLEVIYQRLNARGTRNEGEGAWAYLRSAECHAAHAASTFGEHVATEHLSAREVATLLVQSLESATAQRL